MKRRGECALAVFVVFFALYLWTMPATLAPYRDTGEMVLSSHTLGISHPPSYPLYILLGRVFDISPLATPAHSLNLLSGAAAAGALAVLFLQAAALWGAWPAAVLAALLGTNATYWNVAGVQEMYSLTMLLAAILWLLAMRLRVSFSARGWYATAFLFGVFLGNRTDLLLWAPGLAVLAFPLAFRNARGRDRFLFLAKTAAFGALGLSIYLYLPFRSMQGPWLDWNHPAELGNFIGSLTRRGYGGTLDLLSKHYAIGAMFLPNLKIYAAHLWHNLGAAGLGLAALGLAVSLRADRRRCAGTLLLYLASGPLFLFLANMPPNPHALAIVEPHYLLSDIVVVLWAAEGAAALLSLAASTPPTDALVVGGRPAALMRMRWAAGPLIALLCLLHPLLTGRYAEMDRRWNLMDYDFVGNVFRSTPEGSILIAKKDVQIFSLWYFHRVEGRRPDLDVIAQGLAHSPWYRASSRRGGSRVRLGFMREGKHWERFARENSPGRPPGERIFATTDAEIPGGTQLGPPRGLAVPLSSGAAVTELPWEFVLKRGDYRYDARPDFFTADLIDSHAKARQWLAARQLGQGDHESARRNLLASWSMKRRSPEAASYLGFLHLKRGELERAVRAYESADALYEESLRLTREYHSLPAVGASFAASAADMRLNLGVAYERLGRPRDAEDAYRRALEARPRYAQAHYNIAVLHWKRRDWPRAVSELEAALRDDPDHAEARRYLRLARSRLRRQPR